MKIFYGILIGIIGTILSYIVYMTFNVVTDDCQKCRGAKAKIVFLDSVVIKYAEKNNSYPQDLKTVSKRIMDPWGNPYNYILYQHDQYECFLIWSFGSDNKPGGNVNHESDIYHHSLLGQCIPNQFVPKL